MVRKKVTKTKEKPKADQVGKFYPRGLIPVNTDKFLDSEGSLFVLEESLMGTRDLVLKSCKIEA